MAEYEEVLYGEALTAIHELFNYISSSAKETRANMSSLKDEIDVLLGGLPKDEADG